MKLFLLALLVSLAVADKHLAFFGPGDASCGADEVLQVAVGDGACHEATSTDGNFALSFQVEDADEGVSFIFHMSPGCPEATEPLEWNEPCAPFFAEDVSILVDSVEVENFQIAN